MGPHTPVLVGIGAILQRLDDPSEAREAFELMVDALEAAADDAGSRGLLTEADSIRVPRGFWDYSDPGRLVADRIGAKGARTTLAEIGVLQQTLLSDACRAIASGEESIALVTGAEAKFRELRAKKTGVEVTSTAQTDVAPDSVLVPHEPLIDELEMQRGLMMPVRAFAVMESALRFRDGASIDDNRDEIARLWSDASRIAADNPHAWKRTPVSFEDVREVGPANRLQSFPYAKAHSSDWNVDQASALILCSVERARALGLPESGWIYPLAATESNHVVPVTAREALDRSPGAEVAGARVLTLADVTIDAVDELEIYSCFPAPTRVFQRALGVASDRPFTVTGGMAAAGGPLNNYVLQATIRMAEVLRRGPGSTGLVTSISGFMNKVGYGLWSTEPPASGFRFEDVTDEVAAASPARELAADYEGPARVLGYTVAYLGDAPLEGVAVCETPDGRRTIGISRDPGLMDAMMSRELCGTTVRVDADGAMTIDG